MYEHAPYGVDRSYSAPIIVSVVVGAARAATSATSALLPSPGDPMISNARPCPSSHSASAPSNVSSSSLPADHGLVAIGLIPAAEKADDARHGEWSPPALHRHRRDRLGRHHRPSRGDDLVDGEDLAGAPRAARRAATLTASPITL